MERDPLSSERLMEGYDVLDEPEVLKEHFRMAQARYRTNAILTPKEWPMNQPEGRKAYYESLKRDALLRSR